MNTVYFNSNVSDDVRRRRLYDGQLFVYSTVPSALALCELAREMIGEAFAGIDPLKVHEKMPVEECVAILADLKPRFIHHPKAKECMQGIFKELGCDREKTYFDVPRLRTAFPGDYLTSGIAYAFHPHRDTWYSAPFCQLNWWMPVFHIESDNSMAFHPHYWDSPVRNSSKNYNYYLWNEQSRTAAAQQIKTDTREQPKPLDEIELDPQIRVVGQPGELLLFSGAQLHSTVPNTAGFVRYSIDFRTVNLDDAQKRIGAANIDSECTGTTMRDYLRATDLSRLPEEVIALYNDGTEVAGQLVYQPQGR